MFPFADKGDFAEIGRFVVNAAGSGIYILKFVVVVFALVALRRRERNERRGTAPLLISLATPALVLVIHFIALPHVAVQRTVDAYLAGPQFVGAIFGWTTD